MKLVEILAEEMEKWPKGVTHLTQSAVDREIYNAQDGKDTDSLESLEPRFDAIKSHDERGKYPVVTRAQWQAERDKQKSGEWKRHRGGKQPVADGTNIEYKLRDGSIIDWTAEKLDWRHSNDHGDIMQYRVISQPQAEEVEYRGPFPCAPIGEAVNAIEYDIEFPSGVFTLEAKTDQIDGPIKWRDTVNELDAYIEEFTRERESLINRLAEEGFSLIPAMTPVMGVADIDMGDWRNLKVGDIIECSEGGAWTSSWEGKHVTVAEVEPVDYDGDLPIRALDGDLDDWGRGYKFIRRP